MVLHGSRARGLRVLVAIASLAVVSAAAQAQYVVTHYINDLEAGITLSPMILYVKGPTYAGTSYSFTANPGDTTINDPFVWGGAAPTLSTFVALSGSAVAVGMNFTAAQNATDIGMTFENVFNLPFDVSEADFAQAIDDYLNGTPAEMDAAEVILDYFFLNNQSQFNPVGPAGNTGRVVVFSNGNDVGGYHTTSTFSPTSVPEPFTMLLGGAAAGLGAVRARRRRKAA